MMREACLQRAMEELEQDEKEREFFEELRAELGAEKTEEALMRRGEELIIGTTVMIDGRV